MRRHLWGFLSILPLFACGIGAEALPPPDEPVTPDLPKKPDDPPPTGQVYDPTVAVDGCGHKGILFQLVDEVCGARGAADYMDRFRAPMFRDGAAIGEVLFTVDGTHLWSLDVSDPAHPPLLSLASGVGTPVGVAVHGDNLVIAAGEEGLLVMDVSDAAAPVRKAKVEIPGPALHVTVLGDQAIVAAGSAGVVVVDLAADPPAVVRTIAVPGFAASAKTDGERVYVAACDTFVVADLASGEVLSSTWLDEVDAVVNGVLVAPAKDVELVGTRAIVAAGRYGAVAIDVTDPKAPVVTGDCTVAEELSFYASGVRAEGDELFVAGGEWGVLPVGLAEGGDPCLSSWTPPVLPDIPSPDGKGQVCSADPPWDVVQWTESFSVPPIGWDPIQTLPAGATLYTFGDARRNALRAVDLRQADTPALDKIGRYEEPRRVTAIAAKGGRVVVAGPGGGVFDRDDAVLLKPVDGAMGPPADSVAVRVMDDQRWAACTADYLFVEGAAAPAALDSPAWPDSLEVSGDRIFVTASGYVQQYDTDAALKAYLTVPKTAHLPPALELTTDGLVVAAPEWLAAQTKVGDEVPADLAPHGVFDEADIESIPAWQRGVPHRMLLTAESGIVEVATLGGRAGLFVHASKSRVELPDGDYRDAAATDKRVYLVSADRSAYMSTLVVVDVGESPALVSTEVFTGVANGVAADGDRLYIADGHRGIRVYQRSDDGLAFLGVVTGEVAP